jgi:negative regulator of sigma E activity
MESMCPEPGLISAYVDGEVPSPWKERLAAHIASCPECAARLGKYRALGSALHGEGDAAAKGGFDEAACVARLEARLGGRLGGRIGPADGSASVSAPGSGADVSAPAAEGQSRGPWRRSVALPLPFAIAAAAAMVFLAGLALAGVVRPAKPAVQTLAASEMAPSKAQSMEALVKYLESQDAQVNLTIQLPSGTTFDSSGRPLVVKATDYVPLADPQLTSSSSGEGSGQ